MLLKLSQRRLAQDAFFIARRISHSRVSVMLLVLLYGQIAWASDCNLQHAPASDVITKRASIKNVIDGDTVRLADNRLVRFIGINTPEIDHKFGHSQPYALKARDYLQKVVNREHGILVLQYGQERRDRHGRLLAHVFTSSGGNIQQQMIREGLGVWIVVPPNLAYMHCYQRAEQYAKSGNIGVWNEQFHRPRETDTLTSGDRGFQWIRGKISRLGKGKKFLWLNFDDPASANRSVDVANAYSRVTLRIHRNDLHYFKEYSVESLVGKTVNVKGWMTEYKQQLVMGVRHPASVEIEQ